MPVEQFLLGKFGQKRCDRLADTDLRGVRVGI